MGLDDRTLRGVARLDFGVVRNVERTPIGGMRVDAAITRCGVLVYRDTAGNEFREFVPPDEVFNADSLATLRDAPVTDGHPSALVTPDTFRSVARGHVADNARRDGDFACAPLAVDDGALVQAIDAGERKDISAGYMCDIDPTPGVYEGEPYDRIQRNRRYNHVAVLPPGAGRAGPEVSLRMDGAAVQVRADERAEEQRIVKTPAPITFRGKEYRFDEAAGNYGTLEKDVAAAQKQDEDAMVAMKRDAVGHEAALAAVQQALAEAMGEVAKLKAALDAVQSAVAEEEAQEGEPETGATEAQPEEVLDSMRAVRREVVRAVGVTGLKKGMRRDAVRAIVAKTIDARADSRAEEIARVRTDAAKHLTADECKGKSLDELRKAVVGKLVPTVKMDSLDAKTIATMFDTAVAVVKPADTARRESAAANAALNAALNTRTDAEKNSLDALYEKQRVDAENRWKGQPAGASK